MKAVHYDKVGTEGGPKTYRAFIDELVLMARKTGKHLSTVGRGDVVVLHTGGEAEIRTISGMVNYAEMGRGVELQMRITVQRDDCCDCPNVVLLQAEGGPLHVRQSGHEQQEQDLQNYWVGHRYQPAFD